MTYNCQALVEIDGIEGIYYVHPTATIEPGAVIGKGTKVWAHSHIMREAVIGAQCIIGENVHIGAKVKLGHGCKVQNGVNLYEGVEAEDDCFFGPASQTTNELHIGLLSSDGERKSGWTLGRTIFRRGCAIGANATIICGEQESPTIIGRQSIVGAGSVVTKSVEDFAIVIGNPAKLFRYIGKK